MELRHAEEDAAWCQLSRAAFRGDADLLRAELASGADVNANSGEALHLAAWRGHPEVVRLLLEAGAGLELPTPKGGTALTAAAHGGCTTCLRLLLEAGSVREARNADGYMEAGDGPRSWQVTRTHVPRWHNQFTRPLVLPPPRPLLPRRWRPGQR